MTDETGNEADILFPDRDLVIDGEHITVREFRFTETLTMTPIAQPFINDLAELSFGEEPLEYDAIIDVLARHSEAYAVLTATACDRPVAWIEKLVDKARPLANLFWMVNQDFFTNRLLPAKLAQARKSASAESSTP